MTGKKPATKRKGTKRKGGKTRAARAKAAAASSPKRSPGRSTSPSAAGTKRARSGGGRRRASTGRSGDHGVRPRSKLGVIIAQLQQKGGTTIDAMCKATGWQSHSVRGALSGVIKKKLRLNVQSEAAGGVRHYRIVG